MGDGGDGKRRRLEGVIPEILKRAVEAGVNQAQHAPENLKTLFGDLKVPKEIAGYIFSQVDETKNGLFRVVAKEMRDFLEHTNIAGEMQKMLTTVQFEVNTTIRFRPNEPSDGAGTGDAADGGRDGAAGALRKPEVKTEVTMSRSGARGARERRRRERGGRDTGSSGGGSGGGAGSSGGGGDGGSGDSGGGTPGGDES